MWNYGTKTNNTAPAAGGVLSAEEDNDRFNELKNAVTSAGISLETSGSTPVDQQMLAQAMARYASGGRIGQDTGSANTYVVGGSGTFRLPQALFKYMDVLWHAGADNNGASTLNAWGRGAKPLYDHLGNALVGGEIKQGFLCQATYDPTLNTGSGAYKLAPWSNALLFPVSEEGGTSINSYRGPDVVLFDLRASNTEPPTPTALQWWRRELNVQRTYRSGAPVTLSSGKIKFTAAGTWVARWTNHNCNTDDTTTRMRNVTSDTVIEAGLNVGMSNTSVASQTSVGIARFTVSANDEVALENWMGQVSGVPFGDPVDATTVDHITAIVELTQVAA